MELKKSRLGVVTVCCLSSCVVFIAPCNWAIGSTDNKADSRSSFLSGFS